MKLTQLLRDKKQELEDELKNKLIIERQAAECFENRLSSKLIKIVSGIRRCGKSVFIYLALQKNKFAYMNFDDERLSGFDTNDILSSFYEIYGKDFKIIFLDEIQNLDKWELFVNRIHRSGFNIYLTGSNAKLLSKELATHLTGRHLTMEIFPFSFMEYLKAIKFNENLETTKGISLIKRELKNYMDKGGFPEVVVEGEDQKTYLRELYTKIVEKDIINRYNISYKKTFREIAMNILSNPGRAVSYNKLKNQFSLGSNHTVKNYLSYLEEAYLVFLLNKFSFKPVEIEKSEKKVYSIDTGFINYVSFRSSDDYGALYENVVAIELLRRKAFDPKIEVYYWKSVSQEEIDFVIKEGKNLKQLIQVCYDTSKPDTRKREIRALLNGSKELKCDNLLIITDDYEATETEEWYGTKRKVNFIPLWKWLLEM